MQAYNLEAKVSMKSNITLAVGVSRGFWPHLQLSLSTVPCDLPIVVSWFGDGSPDDLPANAKLVRPARSMNNFSRSYALNVAIRAVETDYVMLADADFLYPTKLFDRLEPDAFSVTRFYVGRLTQESSNAIVHDGAAWEDLYMDYQGVDGRVFAEIFGAHNPCIYSVNVLKRLRGYDENMVGWGGEDDDLSFRTRRVGITEKRLPIIVADLFHEGSPDFPTEYRRGDTSENNLQILNDPNRPIAANPTEWGDGGTRN